MDTYLYLMSAFSLIDWVTGWFVNCCATLDSNIGVMFTFRLGDVFDDEYKKVAMQFLEANFTVFLPIIWSYHLHHIYPI